jgi:hypothetical protein
MRGHHPGRLLSGLDPEGGPDPRLADPLHLVFQHDLLDRVEDGDPAEIVAAQKVRIPSGSRPLYAPAYRSRKPCASNPMIRPFTMEVPSS